MFKQRCGFGPICDKPSVEEVRAQVIGFVLSLSGSQLLSAFLVLCESENDKSFQTTVRTDLHSLIDDSPLSRSAGLLNPVSEIAENRRRMSGRKTVVL
jgi:hypothetical protein